VDEERDEHLGDDVVELVLGTVDGDRRARMAAHVLRCAACRHEYDELAATVEDLLPAVPSAQPPLGFDERVLARMAATRSPAPARPSRRRWAWVAVAAAALVALLIPLGIWVASRDDGASSTGDVATLRLSRDGTAVGSVTLSDIDGSPVMVVALVGAPNDVSYYCRINFADGSTSDSESWPSGNGAWVVPLDPAAPTVTSVDVLPDGTEKIWSAATFT
jgi:anti-sigma factor RsiW